MKKKMLSVFAAIIFPVTTSGCFRHEVSTWNVLETGKQGHLL